MNAEDCLSTVIAFLEDLVNSAIDRRSQRMPKSSCGKRSPGTAVRLW
jgi:hypothetical protein